MPDPVDFALLLRSPPETIIKYLEARGYAITFNWFDIQARAHARSFSVAKAASLDVLRDIRSALTDALSSGQVERDFIKRLGPRLKALGWWGKREIVSDTGVTQTIQEGSPARLKTIYRTNVAVAQNSARYRAQLDQINDRPYGQYLQIQRASKRDAHAYMHGRVFRLDDPIWTWLYPPNGFRCGCRVRTLSERQLQREGLTVESSAGRIGSRVVTLGVDRQSGELIQVEQPTYRGFDLPVHAPGFSPDPGWAHNPASALFDAQGGQRSPGTSSSFSQDFARRHERLAPVPNQQGAAEAGRPRLASIAPGEYLALPTAPGLTGGIDGVAAALQMPGVAAVYRSPVEQIGITREGLTHLAADPSLLAAVQIIPQMIRAPWEVWLTEYADGYRRVYLQPVTDAEGRRALAVLRFNRDGSLVLGFARGKAAEAVRVGGLLWSR